jgi:hypothetical protein
MVARDLIFVAFFVRLAALAVHPIVDSLYSDMGNYVLISDELRSGPWKPTHFFQPLGLPFIVYVLKGLFTNWGTALGIFQVSLSTATVWLVWQSAEKAFGAKVGHLALAVATFHVSWIILATVALPETTFTFLLAVLLRVSLEVIERESIGWSALWGLVFVVAFNVKGSHGFVGPIFLLALLAWKRWSKTAIVRVAAPISVVVGAGLLLHGALTYRAIGSFEMLSTEGGLNFVEGKCPSKRNFDSTGASWFSPLYYQLGRTEPKQWDRPFTDSRYFMKEGLKCIRNNPLVLATSLEGIPFLFVGNTLWPASEYPTARYTRLYDLLFGVFLIVGLTVGYRAMWLPGARNWPAFIAWATPLLGLALCVYVFKSEIRFRVPFDVWLIPVAAAGWVSLLGDRWISRAAESPQSRP